MPGSCNFIGEILVLQSIVYQNFIIGFLVTFCGFVLTSSAFFFIFSRLCMGGVTPNIFTSLIDLPISMGIIMFNSIYFTLLFGIFPMRLLNISKLSLLNIIF